MFVSSIRVYIEGETRPDIPVQPQTKAYHRWLLEAQMYQRAKQTENTTHSSFSPSRYTETEQTVETATVDSSVPKKETRYIY